jgi:hypothetical protein
MHLPRSVHDVICRLALFLALGLGAIPAHAGPAALAVAVQGILQAGEFLGPPGFGENPGSDRGETTYYLQLPAPLAAQVRPSSALAEFSAAAQGTYFIALVVFDEEQSVVRTLVGKKVRVAGSLVETDAAHHKSAAQIQVKSVSPIREWQW